MPTENTEPQDHLSDKERERLEAMKQRIGDHFGIDPVARPASYLAILIARKLKTLGPHLMRALAIGGAGAAVIAGLTLAADALAPDAHAASAPIAGLVFGVIGLSLGLLDTLRAGRTGAESRIGLPSIAAVIAFIVAFNASGPGIVALAAGGFALGVGIGSGFAAPFSRARRSSGYEPIEA